MNDAGPAPAHWPLEVARLRESIAAATLACERDAARGSLWRLLFEALMRYLRLHSRHARGVSPADLEDIASEKALEILARAESGAWDLAGRSSAEISGYISRVARNGWIDLVHRVSREVRAPEGGDPDQAPEGILLRAAGSSPGPEECAESAELTLALRDCVERLPARERRVWFFRAFYDMSSREIAAHPRVGLNAAHVDVVAQRARQALRDCLERKGHAAGAAPAGAFVQLWALLERLAIELGNEPVAPEAGATGRRP